jgi:hypothetical protein
MRDELLTGLKDRLHQVEAARDPHPVLDPAVATAVDRLLEEAAQDDLEVAFFVGRFH